MFRFPFLFFALIFLFLSSCSQVTNGQTPYLTFYRSAEKLYHSANATSSTDFKALGYYRKAILLLNSNKEYNEIMVDCYVKSGILSLSIDRETQAMADFREAILVVGRNSGLSDSLIFRPLMYAGSIFYNQNNLDSALYYFKWAELVYGKYTRLDESERLFNKFGALYYETGDYNKSISYFEKALSMVQEQKHPNIFFIINYKNNIATALTKLGKYQQALKIFEEVLKYPDPGDELIYNTGNTYFEDKNYTAALHYVRKIRNMDFEKFSSLTKIFIRIRQYDSANYYLGKAISLQGTGKTNTSKITRAIILKYSGDLKSAEGLPYEALHDYQSAIIGLDPAFHDTSLTANPITFSGLQNFSFLFEALVAKAAVWSLLGKIKQGSDASEQSLQSYSSALSLAKHIEKTYFSDDARLFLQAKVNPATQDAVDVAIQLYHKTGDDRYVKKAFQFAEDNKATVLQAGLKNLELGNIPGLPIALVADEKKFRIELAKLEIQAGQLKNDAALDSVEREIHDIEISLSSVQDKLDENQVYHDLKFSDATVDMDSVRLYINSKKEAVLSYYYTKSLLICFYITAEGSGVVTTTLNKNLFSTIYLLKKELESPESVSGKSLYNSGTALYADLIQPVIERIKSKSRLIIIPYNEINYVPFEMITLKNGSRLLNNFSISYNYAANFLMDRKAGNKIVYDVLAMAPFSGNGNSNLLLPALPSSGDEINALPGKKFLGDSATKYQFVTLANQFPVIHLATHAVANDENMLGSFIEFYGLKGDPDSTHRLYEKEIYTLNLKSARLVILSACETGNGLLVNGEGVISLSRAFSYAGCKSVITSLWKADEISIAYITKRLHHYLQNGLAADEALRKAKLDYLDTSEIGDRYKNPAFWANLILIGDYRPIMEPGTNWIFWILIATAVVPIISVAGKKITRHKNMPGSLSTHTTDEG